MNKAVLFNGASGKITVSDDSAIQNIFDSGGSVEIYIYISSDGENSQGIIIGKGVWYLRTVGQAASKVKLEFIHEWSGNDGTWITTATEVDLDTWTHIVLTYDSGSTANNPILYVAGSSVTLTESVTPTNTRDTDVGSDLVIGNRAADDRTLDGKLAEARLHTRIIGATEASNNYNGGAGRYWPSDFRNLVGWWHLNEGTGTNVRDETNRGNAGTISTSTKFEYYNTGDDNAFGIWGVHWLTQTFTPSVAHKITSVKLKIFREGSPGTLTVSIRATSGGEPIGGDLCSGTIDGNGLTTDIAGAWYEITLGAGCDLDADTKYAIVARAPSGSDAGNAVNWRGDSSSPTYSGGAALYSDNSGVDWSGYDVDRMFEEWGRIMTFPDGFDFMNMTHVSRRR